MVYIIYNEWFLVLSLSTRFSRKRTGITLWYFPGKRTQHQHQFVLQPTQHMGRHNRLLQTSPSKCLHLIKLLTMDVTRTMCRQEQYADTCTEWYVNFFGAAYKQSLLANSDVLWQPLGKDLAEVENMATTKRVVLTHYLIQQSWPCKL